MTRMTLSKGTKWCPSVILAYTAASRAREAPWAFLSMQGIWTSPLIGSQVRPRKCSMPMVAAYSTCRILPPSNWAAAAAAMEQALPTSPWHPTSAPATEALVLIRLPIRPAVASARSILISDASVSVLNRYNTAGITPQEPQVGAVTTLPPAAFSSETARA